MSTKHTPGPTIYTPWHPEGDTPAPWLVEDTDDRCVVRDACGGLIADCTNGFHDDEGDWRMSAAVGPLAVAISAMPELLEAAQMLVTAQSPHMTYRNHAERRAYEKLRAAIAKATGSKA